jgi:hypothetical protein
MDAASVTAMTDAVDFAAIITGIGSVFAGLIVLAVAIVGGRKLVAVLR